MIYVIDHYYAINHQDYCFFIESEKSVDEMMEILAGLEFFLELYVFDETATLTQSCLLKILLQYFDCVDVNDKYKNIRKCKHLKRIDSMVETFRVGSLKFTKLDLYEVRETRCGPYCDKLIDKCLPTDSVRQEIKELMFNEGIDPNWYINDAILKNSLNDIERIVDIDMYILKNAETKDSYTLFSDLILHGQVDIKDIPRNVRLMKCHFFSSAMKSSCDDFNKSVKCLKLYYDDLTQLSKYESESNKDTWYNIFASYTSKTLKQCIVGREDITLELKNDLMDFLFNLPQEIRNQI